MNEPGTEPKASYHTKMNVKSIITNPVSGEVIPTSGYLLAGAAWSGEEDVVKVEISTDSGSTWNPADIVRPRSGYGNNMIFPYEVVVGDR